MNDIVGYICPKCKCEKLEEVMVGVNLSSTINRVCEGGDIEYDGKSLEGGEIECYQCNHCGDRVVDKSGRTIIDCVELYDRLLELGNTHNEHIVLVVEGYVRQKIRVVNPKVTLQQLEESLKEGSTIQKDETIMIVDSEGKNVVALAEVLSVDSLKYEAVD